MPNLVQDDNNNNSGAGTNTDAYHLKTPKKRKFHWWWPVFAVLIVVILIGLGFITKVVLAINSTNTESGKKVSFFDQVKHLFINPEKEIIGETENRINILLAGIGGAGHQGAYLADTIIVASIKPSTKEVAMISIPRDLYVEIPGYGYRKINNAMAFGETSDYPGGGEALLSKVVENVLDLPIHYYARIDFEGFRKAIDDLGGVDIYVDNTFTDYQYPDYNYGYQTVTFKKGWEKMDGERALQFVRSRHGTNGEGSDFARSKRQQKVIFAVKEQFLSLNNIIDPSKVISALESLGEHNQTSLEIWEIVNIVQMLKDTEQDSVITQVLETGEGGQLFADSTADGAYILRPKGGDFSEIQFLANNIFNTSFITRENAKIEIQNSTSVTGLASKTAEELSAMKYNIIGVGNSSVPEPLTQTTIYDLSGGTKPYTVVSLKNILKADVAASLPAYMIQTNLNTAPLINANINAEKSDIDILIIIGTDLIPSTQLSIK